MDFRSLHSARRIKDNNWESVDGIKDHFFVIKYYQRGYRWTRNNIHKLLHDIETYIEKDAIKFPEITDYIKDSSRRPDKVDLYDFYCLQALSVQCLNHDKKEYELIDGQQRLTSILLLYELLGVFTEAFEDRPDPIYTIQYIRGKSDSFNLTEYIHKSIPSRVDGVSPLKAYRLPRNKDRDDWFEKFMRQLSNNLQNPAVGDLQLAGDSLIIDLYYLSEVACQIVEYIKEFRDDEGNNDNIKKYFTILKQNVLFIWYEIPTTVSAEEEFISLNSNKINLTNAELIKALVLREDENGNVLENAGNRWEAIEQGLCKDEIWAFIGGEDKATRIDLILELIARRESNYVPDINNENALFDWFEQKKGEMPQSDFSKFVIEHAERIYNRICEWYDDVEIFHYIGLLTCYRDRLMKKQSQEEMIKKIYDDYDKSVSKENFSCKLRSMIKDCILFGIKNEDRPSAISEVVDLNLFSYEDSAQQNNIKAILWYLNAWETIEASENNIMCNGKKQRKPIIIKRLPFSQINNVKTNKASWTLEHIMPQNPDKEKDSTQEDKKNYENLMNDISNDSATGAIINSSDVHMLGNMALLTHSDNSAIHNGNLLIKRQELIQKAIGEGSFVPVATINAFGLYYNMIDNYNSNEIDNKYWTMSNRERYLKRIKQALDTLK